jgi:hypothetical protein
MRLFAAGLSASPDNLIGDAEMDFAGTPSEPQADFRKKKRR